MQNTLRQTRQQRGHTQMTLSVASGIPQTTISKLERGSSPYYRTAVRLAKVLKVTPAKLFPAEEVNTSA